MKENTGKIYMGEADALLGAPLKANGAGSTLFVINLCASMAPVNIAEKTLPGLDNYRLYQVSRVEDGRTRYRLRLGFFKSQSDAEGVLPMVRQMYATAFTSSLSDEDRKFARGYLPEPPAATPANRNRAVGLVTPAITPAAPAPVPSAKQSTPPVATKPAQPKAAPPQQAAAATANRTTPVAKATPATPVPAKAAAAAKPAVATPAPAAKSTTPVNGSHVAKPVVAEAPEIEVEWEPEAPPAVNKAANAKKPAAAASDFEVELSWEPPSLPAAPASKAAPSAPASAKAAQTTPAKSEPAAAKPKNEPVAAKPKTEPVTKSKPAEKAAPAAKAPSKPAATVQAAPLTIKASSFKQLSPLELQLEAEAAASAPVAKKESAPSGSPQPFHVGKGLEISTSLSLQQEPPVQIKVKAPAQSPAKPAAAPSRTLAPAAKASEPVKKDSNSKESVTTAGKLSMPAKPAAVAATPPAATAQPAAPQLPPRLAALPDLDSTQTIRALTSDELKEDAQEKWFAIQLAISEQPVNLDAMPHLDIFEAYRLYSVANAGSGKILHSLRLGFFREAVSAEAVSGYLKTFFSSPSVLRISAAEQLRFKDPPKPKRAAEPKSEAKVIDLNHARDRNAKPAIPTVTMEVAPARGKGADRSPTGTFKAIDRSPTGTFKAAADRSPSGTFKAAGAGAPPFDKAGSSGSHKVLTPALKPAAKSTGTAVKRSAPVKSNGSQTGKYKALNKKSLHDELMEEAREVELSESGIRKMPKNDSLLSRLVDKLKK